MLTLAGAGRDRGHALRREPAALRALLSEGSVLPVWRGRPLCAPASLGWLRAGDPVLEGAGEPVFLGFLSGRAVFAADVSHWCPEVGLPGDETDETGRQPHPFAPAGHAFAELRSVMTMLSPDEAEIAATARALLEWHRGNGFCPACGTHTRPEAGGWHRVCPQCRAQNFPRTDPAVIMLVTRGERLLLGRSPGWPARMFSLLAGFVEPGETVEAAVRREVAEETGIRCERVEYLASQPWPFPASLMLGCRAEALDEAITLERAELDDALWLSREEAIPVLAGVHPAIRPPRAGSIARYLMENWLAGRPVSSKTEA